MSHTALRTVSASFGANGLIISKKIDAPSAITDPLLQGARSVLYLPTDEGDDRICEAGFPAFASIFEGSAIHFPLRSNFCEGAEPELVEELTVALESLPRPTLILCTGGRRAAAVANVFIGTRHNISGEEMLQACTAQGAWCGDGPSAKCLDWVRNLGLPPSPGVPSIVASEHRGLVFRQLWEKETSSFTYILGDPISREAIIIDPVDGTAERDRRVISQLGLTLKYAVNTHVHADHITGSGLLKQAQPDLQSAISAASGAKADVTLLDRARITFGSRFVTALATPGHTAGCMSFVLDDHSAVFTGDTLLIRGCGRTDFQQGNSATLFSSVHSVLYALPPDTAVFPAHDYKGETSSTILEERTFNPRLNEAVTQSQFVEIMAGLKLPLPKRIDDAVPANLVCGIHD